MIMMDREDAGPNVKAIHNVGAHEPQTVKVGSLAPVRFVKKCPSGETLKALVQLVDLTDFVLQRVYALPRFRECVPIRPCNRDGGIESFIFQYANRVG